METDVNLTELREVFLDNINSIPSGFMKEASAAATKFTRRKLRESSFCREVLPFDTVNNDDLDYFLASEHPGIICEMEPDSYGAKIVTFEDAPDYVTYEVDKYLLLFFRNTTPEYTKNVNLLRTTKMDIRGIVTDNAFRDLNRNLDVRFQADIDDLVGASYNTENANDLIQAVKYSGGINRTEWVDCKQILPDRSLDNGIFVCNRRTFSTFELWKREEMGGDFAEKTVREGIAGAMEKASFGGIDFIVTYKNDLIPNGVIYQYASPNYLGRAGVLQAPTMFVSKDKDIIKMSCHEMVGFSIGNVAAVQKVAFADAMGAHFAGATLA